MPYYKKINYVEQSIDSVLNQSYQDLELIIIYDDENKEEEPLVLTNKSKSP